MPHMTPQELLNELSKLTLAERLVIIEAALRLLREDLQQLPPSVTQSGERHRLAAAAEALLADYRADSELTSFTALDSDDFHV